MSRAGHPLAGCWTERGWTATSATPSHPGLDCHAHGLPRHHGVGAGVGAGLPRLCHGLPRHHVRAICRARSARHPREGDSIMYPLYPHTVFGARHVLALVSLLSPHPNTKNNATHTSWQGALAARELTVPAGNSDRPGLSERAQTQLDPFPGAQRRFEARKLKPWSPAVFPRSQNEERPTRGRGRAEPRLQSPC